MITTGDIKISVLVDKADGGRALRAVHHAFGLHELQASRAPSGGTRAPAAGFRKRTDLVEADANRGPPDVVQKLNSMEDIVVSDVLLDDNQGRITIFGLPDRPGCCSQVFQAVAAAGIIVDLIVQNLNGPGRAEMTFSVPRKDLQKALEVTSRLVKGMDPETAVSADPDIAKLFVLGVGMRTHTGVARRMFGALAQRNINISMINTSEVRVSVVVDRKQGRAALECLKQAFAIA
jgi:aspartate kinase